MSDTNSFLDLDLNLRDAAGGRLPLTTRRFAGVFAQRGTQGYLALVLVILLAADPSGLRNVLPFSLFALAWVFGSLVYFALQICALMALGVMRSRWQRPMLYWPVISLLCMTPTLEIVLLMLKIATGQDMLSALRPMSGYLLLTVILFETLYMRFMLPREVPEAAAELQVPPEPKPEPAPVTALPLPEPAPPSEPEPESRVVVIGNQPVPLHTVRVIEASEHHVHVRLDGKTLTQRARLSDIVAQTRPEDGIQPHRSWWVARKAARGLDNEGNRPVLRLNDDLSVPVARGRLAGVRRWLDTYLN